MISTLDSRLAWPLTFPWHPSFTNHLPETMLFFLPGASWLLVVAGMQAVSASCLNNIQNNTIGFFSSAPLTFSYKHPSAFHCAFKCEKLEHCQAWLYADPGDCQLYRRAALSTASNPNFLYGLCDGASPRPSPSASPSMTSGAVVPTVSGFD